MKKLREGIDFIFRSNSMQDSLGRKAQHDSPGSERIFYRAVWSEQEPWLRELRSSASYHQIVAQGMLEDEVPDPDLSIDGYGVVLRQRKVPFFLKPWKIPLERRITMASSWVEINMLLAKDGFGLRDAHLGNWAFSNRQEPIWVDVGSIVRLTTGREGFDEFRAWNLRPLDLTFSKSSNLDEYLQNEISRIRYLNMKYPILERFPFAVTGLLLHDDILMKALRRLFAPLADRIALAQRKIILRSWLFRIKRWRSDFSGAGDTSTRQMWRTIFGRKRKAGTCELPNLAGDWASVVAEIIRGTQAKTILMIGAMGWGDVKEVIPPETTLWVIDPDHGVMSRFTRELVSSEMDPTIKVCGAIDSFLETDVRADLVIAIGWSNRLLFEHGIDLPAMARRLAELATLEILFDFDPAGVAIPGEGTSARGNESQDFSVEKCVNQIRKFFPRIQTWTGAGANSQTVLIHGRRASSSAVSGKGLRRNSDD